MSCVGNSAQLRVGDSVGVDASGGGSTVNDDEWKIYPTVPQQLSLGGTVITIQC